MVVVNQRVEREILHPMSTIFLVPEAEARVQSRFPVELATTPHTKVTKGRYRPRPPRSPANERSRCVVSVVTRVEEYGIKVCPESFGCSSV